MEYCKGSHEHIVVTELEGKAWHDDDLYLMECKKCGKTERCLSRRPNQTIMLCGDIYD